MPSKVQEAEIDDGVEDMMPMGYPDMPERKEYLWSCDLEGIFVIFVKKTHNFFRWKSSVQVWGWRFRDRDYYFQIGSFGRGCLWKTCRQGVGRRRQLRESDLDLVRPQRSGKVWEVSSFLLNLQNCWLRLPELSIEPPLLLSLAEGKGPVNICANHLLEEDPEMDDEDDEEADSEEMANIQAASPVSFFG